MTKTELKKIVDKHTTCASDYEAIWRAVEAYSSASNGAKPIVSGSLPPADNRILFAEYIQRCVIERGQMTYPSLQDAIKAWDETTERFGGNDR